MKRLRRRWRVGLWALLLAACTEPTGPAAVKLHFLVGPNNATAGIAIGPVVAVEIQDAYGFTVTRATNVVTLGLGTYPTGATLAGTVSVSAVNGVASFPTVHIDKAQTGYTLTATASELIGETSAPFSVAAGAATTLVFAVQPRTTMVGAAVTPPVEVAARDAFGNTATGFSGPVTVTLAGTPAAGALSGTTTSSAVYGVATFGDLAIEPVQPGYILAANAPGLTGVTSVPFAVSQPTGSVRITTATTGTALDPDGFAACIDSTSDGQGGTACAYGGPQTIGVNRTVTVTADTGAHTVRLMGLARNCAVTGDNPRPIHIARAGTTAVPFAVECAPLTLHITATTVGDSLDSDYSLCIDPYSYSDYWDTYSGCRSSAAIAANTGVTMPVEPGTHVIELDGVAGNCELAGTPSRTVDANSTGEVPFAITCFATGSVRITTATSGTDLDPDGYTVCVDRYSESCFWQAPAQTNGVITIAGVTARPHTVRIRNVASNCSLSGDSTRAVIVSPVGTDVRFDVVCVWAERIAFSADGVLVVIHADGSAAQGLVSGRAPAWSPDGARLAYECALDICAINADGTGFTQLTVDGGSNRHPTWSPDGLHIAFAAVHAGLTGLYVMAPNGAGLTLVAEGFGVLGSPAWSPDGTKLAFDCAIGAAAGDICVVNADGSGLVRLTDDPARDHGAAWKPDGSTIAFTTARYGGDQVALLNVGSGVVTPLVRGLLGFSPTWSPDGTQIAFVQVFTCGFYDYCTGSHDVVLVAGSDGSNVEYLTDGDQPAWRPHP